jgi:hypothetical protein
MCNIPGVSEGTSNQPTTEIWNPPLPPTKFPSPFILPGVRSAVVEVALHKNTNGTTVKEPVYLIRRPPNQEQHHSSTSLTATTSPAPQAYRKLWHIRPVKMSLNEGSIITCLVLPLRPKSRTSPSGAAVYEEPSPDDGSHQIVTVKKY